MSDKRELSEVESDRVFELLKSLHSFPGVLLNYCEIPESWFEATGKAAEYKESYNKAVEAVRHLITFRPTDGPEFAGCPEKERPHYMVFLDGIEAELIRVKLIEELCFKAYTKFLGTELPDPEKNFKRAIKPIQEDNAAGFVDQYTFDQLRDGTAENEHFKYLEGLKKPAITYFEWLNLPEYCEKINDVVQQKGNEAEAEIAKLWAQYLLKEIDSITLTSANEHRNKQKGVNLKESFASYIWDVLQLPDNTAAPWRNRFYALPIFAYQETITAAVEAKAEEFAKARNKRSKTPAAVKATSKRTDAPETGVSIMQGKGLDDFIRQTSPADIPLLAYMISDKAQFNTTTGQWTAPLHDFLALSKRRDTPDTRKSIRASLKRLRQTEYSFDDSSKNGSGIDFAFGSESGIVNDYIRLQVTDRAAVILIKCKLLLDVPAFLYRLPSKDPYTFKMWYKLTADIYTNMGKSEVASKAQQTRIKSRLGRLSVQKICEYIGLETDIEPRRFRERLFGPFNDSLRILAENDAISYSFCYPGEETPLTPEEYNNISFDAWRSLILHFEIPVNSKALEGKIKALQKNGNAERAKQTKQQTKRKSRPQNAAQKQQEREPEKTFSGVTPGLLDD